MSQTISDCEGPRATLTATVKPQPALPGVTNANLCQFAATGPVQATGTALTWYNATDGSRFGAAPTPVTTQGGSVSYAVTQTVDGCESAKNTLVITVLTTPKPVVARTTVELCQSQTTTALDATGTSLKWYLPDGSSVAQAPTPPTASPSQQSGDAYAVTQTINGCESERTAIRVFVQSTPGLSLSGTSTVNLGQDSF